jgi:Protein of unknown function (DUF2442)
MSNNVRAVDVKFTKDSLIAYLEDGRAIEVPLEWYPRLAHAPAAKLRNYEWIGRGLGITWPELDEDLSVEGFLNGVRAPRTAAYMDFPWRKPTPSGKRAKPIPTAAIRPRVARQRSAR